jgi:hypothetical protein
MLFAEPSVATLPFPMIGLSSNWPISGSMWFQERVTHNPAEPLLAVRSRPPRQRQPEAGAGQQAAGQGVAQPPTATRSARSRSASSAQALSSTIAIPKKVTANSSS